MEKRTGGCRCGAIRYEVAGRRLRRSPVTAATANTSPVAVPTSRWCSIFKAKPTSGGSFFCASCGVHVFSGPDSHPELVAIKVGGLDDRSDFRVQADMWMKSAPPWHRPHEGARQVAGNLA